MVDKALEAPEATPRPGTRILVLVLRTYLTLLVPVLLLLIGARLVMTPVFLNEEYNRPDFPEDFYGMTTQERLEYAPYAVQYLLNGADISFLGNLTFPDGRVMYSVGELHHMRDVKTVTQGAFTLAVVGGIIGILAGWILWRDASARNDLRRNDLRQALQSGSILTLALVATIIIMALINWDFFFTGFHNLFFQSGTWVFAYSDTLIRLFPEQFWFDAALVIGGITVAGALAILLICRRLLSLTS
jgi:integral membrane protein (TIGR01906 family)